jgi:hypothetical protein
MTSLPSGRAGFDHGASDLPSSPHAGIARMSAPGFVADFDSASAMLRAVARFLHGQDFRRLGMDDLVSHLIPVANRLPHRLREEVYTWSGWAEAIDVGRLGSVELDAVGDWALSAYPDRAYPAVAIGSSNGAAVHLWAALGIPWIPQTVLVPVRRSGVDPDEIADDLEWGRRPARELLDANPGWQLHHMHDPNQDRLMVRHMTYFRCKRRRLADGDRAFLDERLAPGGTIIVVECRRSWPVTTVGERHYFQSGAMGGLSPSEYHEGSPRVADYLERYDSHRSAWDPPEPDDERPEAEWGFEPALLDDLAAYAERRGLRLLRLAFTEPEDLSPMVADLHRAWYRRRGLPADRLVAESFILLEPWWMLRTGSVPYWALFGVEESARRLEAYLSSAPSGPFGAFREARVMLFPHGTEGAGLAHIERWREALHDVPEHGFLGVDTDEFPRDFAALYRYHPSFIETVPSRYPMPGPLLVEDLEAFVTAHGARYGVELVPAPGADPALRAAAASQAAGALATPAG